MKYLLMYKGDFNNLLKGPELRYVNLANRLFELNNDVCIVSKKSNGVEDNIKFFNIKYFFLKAIQVDVIILHGGGPLILIYSLLLSLFGKTIILDSYVPHWIELSEILKVNKSIRLLVKSCFNSFRTYFSCFVFNAVIVANQRQLDLIRGFVSPLLLTYKYKRFHIIPFGCDDNVHHERTHAIQIMNDICKSNINEDDFIIGWLGGTYGWFDISSVLVQLNKSIEKNNKIKIIFFGVNDVQKNEFLLFIDPRYRDNFIFSPWIEFKRRFHFWSCIDISLVWGGAGYENDYASRTRNFDCVTLNIPIIQNYDDEWGARIRDNGCGKVVLLDELALQLYDISVDSSSLSTMRLNMQKLNEQLNWSVFCKRVVKLSSESKMVFYEKILGVLIVLFSIPVLFLSYLYLIICLLLEENNE